jgi:hypothetical protein
VLEENIQSCSRDIPEERGSERDHMAIELANLSQVLCRIPVTPAIGKVRQEDPEFKSGPVSKKKH